MSERERWIVYPLLFLALAKQTRTENVVCERLYLVDPEGRPVAEVNGSTVRLAAATIQCASLQALRVDSQAYFQGGRQLALGAGQGVTQGQLLGLLQRLGLLRLVPGAVAPPDVKPPPATPPAAENRPEEGKDIVVEAKPQGP